MKCFYFFTSFLKVLSLLLVTEIALAAGSPWAVFKVSYRADGGEVLGGVAGTAFFAKNDLGYSAFHVLNNKIFEPAKPGYLVKIWLVHEGEKAVLVRPSDLQYQPTKDLTVISGLNSQIPKKHLFDFLPSSSLKALPLLRLTSMGFRANSDGPKLEWKQGSLEVSSVPNLDRIQSAGEILSHTNVSIQASDVKLNSVPSFHIDYLAVQGMSGGPVLVGNQVIAFNSFADPISRKTWAVSF